MNSLMEFDELWESTFCDVVLQVRGIPMGKPRQTQRDKWKPSPAVQRYRAWADKIRAKARKSYKGEPWEGSVSMYALFVMPIPASTTKKNREAIIRGDVEHTKQPDLDNLLKGLKDALQGIIYVNDSQVFSYTEPTQKVYGLDEQIGIRAGFVFHE